MHVGTPAADWQGPHDAVQTFAPCLSIMSHIVFCTERTQTQVKHSMAESVLLMLITG